MSPITPTIRVTLPHSVEHLIVDYLLEDGQHQMNGTTSSVLYVDLQYDLVCKRWFNRVSMHMDNRLKAKLIRTDNTIYSFLSHIINPSCVWKNIKLLDSSSYDDYFVGCSMLPETSELNRQLNAALVRMLTVTLERLIGDVAIDQITKSVAYQYLQMREMPLEYELNIEYLQHQLGRDAAAKQAYETTIKKLTRPRQISLYTATPIPSFSRQRQAPVALKHPESSRDIIQDNIDGLKILALTSLTLVVPADGGFHGFNSAASNTLLITLLRYLVSTKRHLGYLGLQFTGEVPSTLLVEFNQVIRDISCSTLFMPNTSADYAGNTAIRHLVIDHSSNTKPLFDPSRLPPLNLQSLTVQCGDHTIKMLENAYPTDEDAPLLETVNVNFTMGQRHQMQPFHWLLTNNVIKNLTVTGMDTPYALKLLTALYHRALSSKPTLPNLEFVHLVYINLNIDSPQPPTLRLLLDNHNYRLSTQRIGVMTHLYLFNKSSI
ncbi:hypothetical protein DFA_00790 [Cavenderia fasciculata]|uniref:Uncharacterized protein n=1 Tax=Cavenderia fasciculata TaxID=261658 RepID=F4PTU4_CACFS|nr:uncharacterized protein DFA_00790 [Cavenderia fasciculata]EGG20923.1 hypothetical protein DFA_00790 [Cavenderia fasciculata]|eukprot:XP_004358773.1 hypothetical protein DFA_00790 [Cavenderia fasciculata]